MLKPPSIRNGVTIGTNPGDNSWQRANRLGAIDLASSGITRVVHGTGADLEINAQHPDTLQPIVGQTSPCGKS